MPYKVIDIYKDLPQTNCGECNRPGCFAFATAVYIQGAPLSGCPYLSPEALAGMNEKLGRQSDEGESIQQEKSRQALDFLSGEMAKADFSELAKNCGAKYVDSPERGLQLRFLNTPYEIRQDDAVALQGPEPTIWVKIFLMIYATRSKGQKPSSAWTAFRDLPNTTSKAKSYEECCEKIAAAFSGKLDELDSACSALGGQAIDNETADRAYRFDALPFVSMQLLFWDGDEDFEARASVLLAENVLDYLDQEAIVFMVEAFERLLQGADLEGVIP